MDDGPDDASANQPAVEYQQHYEGWHQSRDGIEEARRRIGECEHERAGKIRKMILHGFRYSLDLFGQHVKPQGSTDALCAIAPARVS